MAATRSLGSSSGGSRGSSGGFAHFLREVLAGAAAAILAAGVLAYVAYLAGVKHGEALYQKKLEDAASVYSVYIGDLISAAREDKNSGDLSVDARAIVSTRNDLRSSLTSLADLLDSDIDRLEQLDKDVDAKRANPEQVQQQVRLLAKKWPIKKRQIDIEVRKLVTELGLEVTGKSTED